MIKKFIGGFLLAATIAVSAAPAMAAEPASAAPAPIAAPTATVQAAPQLSLVDSRYVVVAEPLAISTPDSFSIDMSGLMDQAADFFNGLFPAFTPVIAIRLGLGIVLLVVSAIGGALSMHR